MLDGHTNLSVEGVFYGDGRSIEAVMNGDALPDPLPVGFELGRHLIIDAELTQTSMGRLYRARYPSLDRTVAVYVLAVDPQDRQGSSRLWRAAGNATKAGQMVYEVGDWLGVTFAVVGFSEERGALVDLPEWLTRGPFAPNQQSGHP